MIMDRISELSKFIDKNTFEMIRQFITNIYLLNYREGTYIFDEGLVATVSSYTLQNGANCKVEIHKHHIDIQATLSGVEGISIFDYKDIEECSDYDDCNDVSFPAIHNTPIVRIANIPGYFSLIYPNEPHRPKELIVDGFEKVKKYVIKIDTDIYPQ